MTSQPISRLTLGRFSTGELDTDETERVSAAIAQEPSLQEHLDRIKRARSSMPALDVQALRDRAGVAAVPANDNRAFLAVVPILLAAAVALFFVIPSPPATTGSSGLRGESVLSVYHLEQGGLSIYDQRALGAGDVLGFKVDPGTHNQVVLLSIDGSGALSVHYPNQGDAEPLDGAGSQALPGSVILDDAPGPEVFVAVFGQTVSEASTHAKHAWQAGGMQGLQDWARAANVDLSVVNRK